jgi:hypothetical protein
MKKIVAFSFVIAIVAFACKPAKKVQSIQTAFTKKDTAQKIIVKENPKIDSAVIVRDIMQKVASQKIDFNTFNAKIKVDYESAEESRTVTAYLSIQKDSIIFIQINYSIAGVVLEAIISKDSVVLVDKIKKKILRKSINYLKEITEIPFDFGTLQDLIVGNPVFLSSNIVSYKSGEQQLQVFMMGTVFKHLLNLDKSDFTALHSKLDDVDVTRNRTCDITFDNYEQANGKQFAKSRKISIAEKSKLDLNLEFKKYSFNDPLAYMFTIPKNYKRK